VRIEHFLPTMNLLEEKESGKFQVENFGSALWQNSVLQNFARVLHNCEDHVSRVTTF
jgi:hypothetical protein